MRASGRAHVRRERLARALVEPDRMVEEELRETARREPRKAAGVSCTADGESPIALEAVPPEERRLCRGAGHGLHGIPHELADTPDFEALSTGIGSTHRPAHALSRVTGIRGGTSPLRPRCRRSCSWPGGRT